MPADLATAPITSSSRRTVAPSASGVPGDRIQPGRRNFSRTSGTAMARTIASFTRATISGGVPAGANIPIQTCEIVAAHAGFRDRGDVGQQRLAGVAHHGQRLQLALP